MITVDKKLPPSFSVPEALPGGSGPAAFFDIETTGFSGNRDRLYLIGCLWRDGKCWRLVQWFADCEEAEKELLEAFFRFLGQIRCLIHFNGDTFDIPFLLKRCAAHGLSCNFDGVESLDIYRRIRPLRRLLGMESLKQKSVEQFLGLSREDKYTGGQLIEVYHRYLAGGDRRLLELLLLHNEEDLTGMPAILPILRYPAFLNGPFSFQGQRLRKIPDWAGKLQRELVLTYEGPTALPAAAELSQEPFTLSLAGTELQLCISLFEGELKRFYSDFRNYYYLIYEDCAVHKSVGQFVDRDARRKATAGTCYTRVAGLFLPQPAPFWEETLKESCRSRETYTPYSEALFEEKETAVRYLEAVLPLFFADGR